MIGLFLLLIAVIWIGIAFRLSVLLTRRISNKSLRHFSTLLIFFVAVPLPLIDEIIGGRNFEKLCQEKAEVFIDAANTQGRTVWFGSSERTSLNLGTIRVIQAKRNYVDASTQEPIYHYYRMEATGGWLIRTLGMFEGDSPLFFHGFCQAKNTETIDAQLGLMRINRPTSR